MVKSANDMAVVLAEGVSGSVENFSAEMNTTSKNLGMTQSSWVNPNGLPADEQISSARDLAILARALLHDFPEYDMYWHIPAIQLGKKYMRNFNTLIGRYEGADGMKTGFICASGFNLVATASRNGKRLIAVVLGAPSSPYRAAKAAGLLERGFHRGPLSWLSPSLGTVNSLQPINAAPPDLRDEMCGPHRKRPAAEDADDDGEASSFMLSNLPPSTGKASALLKDKPDTVKAIAVFIGAAKNAAEAQFASARAKIQKLAKGKKADPKAARHDAAAPTGHRRQGHRCRQAGGSCASAADRHGSAARRFHADAQPASARRPQAAGRHRSQQSGVELCGPGGQDRPGAADGHAGCQGCQAAGRDGSGREAKAEGRRQASHGRQARSGHQAAGACQAAPNKPRRPSKTPPPSSKLPAIPVCSAHASAARRLRHCRDSSMLSRCHADAS